MTVKASVLQDGAWWVSVSGTVNTSGAGAATVTVSGAVQVSQSGNWTVSVSGAQNVSGTVTVSGTVPVSQSGNWTVSVSGNQTVIQGSAGSAAWLTDLRRGVTVSFAVVSAATSGANIIVSGVASNKLKVLSYVIVAGSTATAQWRSDSTNISGPFALLSNGGISAPPGAAGTSWHFETAAGSSLILFLTTAQTVGGHVAFITEA